MSETKYEDWLKLGHEDQVFVSKTQVLQKAADLCHLLQYEYLFKLVSCGVNKQAEGKQLLVTLRCQKFHTNSASLSNIVEHYNKFDV